MDRTSTIGMEVVTIGNGAEVVAIRIVVISC